MRIALLMASAERGGVSTVTFRLARALADAGHEVTIHVLTGTPTVEAPANLTLVTWQKPNVRSAIPDLRRLFRSRQYDAVVSAQYYVNVAVAVARPRRSPERLLFVEHGTISMVAAHGNRRDRWMPIAMRWAYRRADVVAAVSKGAADDLTTTLGRSSGTVLVLPNPVLDDVDPPVTPAPPDHPWFTGHDLPIVLAVGRLAPEKRLPDLVAAHEILAAGRRTRLVVVGEGPERPHLEQLIASSPQRDDMWLVGDRKDAVTFMHHADVLVLCSEFEGHPVVLVEGLHAGCRIVSTDCPNGPREILQGGRLGALVPVGDTSALARAIATALDSRPPDPSHAEQVTREYRAGQAAARYLDALGVRTA